MNNDNIGYIYILTNKSFPDYIKIGYTNNIKQRLNSLNTSTPYNYHVYATYQVFSNNADLLIHNIIDLLNPNLRFNEKINGKNHIKEFYKVKPEDAFKILSSIAKISNTEDKLIKFNQENEKKPLENLPFNVNVVNNYLKKDNLQNRFYLRERKNTNINLRIKPSTFNKFSSICKFFNYSQSDLFEIMLISMESQAIKQGWSLENNN